MTAKMTTTHPATTSVRAKFVFFGTEVQKNSNNKSSENRCKNNTCFNDLWKVWKSKVVVGAKVQNCVRTTGDANSDTLVEKDDFVMKFQEEVKKTILLLMKFQEQVKKGDSVMKFQEQVIFTWAVLNTLSVFQVPAWNNTTSLSSSPLRQKIHGNDDNW